MSTPEYRAKQRRLYSVEREKYTIQTHDAHGKPLPRQRRWTTREQVLARIKELERLPPLRTQPTDFARKWKKGRPNNGINPPVPDWKVHAILSDRVTRNGVVVSVVTLAKRYGLHDTTVYKIVKEHERSKRTL